MLVVNTVVDYYTMAMNDISDWNPKRNPKKLEEPGFEDKLVPYRFFAIRGQCYKFLQICI